jgi:hypothetical protein
MFKRIFEYFNILARCQDIVEGHTRDIKKLKAQIDELTWMVNVLAEDLEEQRRRVARLEAAANAEMEWQMVELLPPAGYEPHLN